ncbi:MAG: LysR family transcriptional regulator [Ewingella americana]|jgi:DNA-binding transcriptional LysR family regulator|uniref:LysR family transcriptional regulator n=1 Tax=Ewingella americana TaxID=41202 RepID=UPI00242BE041|nr:LysR family transcriptional regulator [Ewingella americana]MCI1678319.1 LysR family transcriptional regulator [Ewingella americana]MCI1856044.1 LysR family transcriptional regulator [Ewingella americana]MCI1862269.1 LysR family transcriptional regulator [Ewingella americana]MCI2142778.1 LysR family transcriptional regulator [Ewingella americana]MCI2162569.1 LysR family transcriptional regulator [Ewingella americana]
MNLRTLDLNLLVVLDALLDEAHVTRAADRLCMSQSATSAALARCRSLFNDPLLERGRGTMRLTPYAQTLRAPLKSLLGNVVELINPPSVPLDQIQQTLRITMADYPALFVIGPLMQTLQASAPGINLVIQAWAGADSAKTALLNGSTDIAVSVFPQVEEELYCKTLLEEEYVVAMREQHPAAANFDIDGWLAYPHIVVSGKGENTTPVDAALAQRGLSRRVGLVLPNFQMVPPLLSRSDLMALLPSRVVPLTQGITALPLPVPVAGFPLHIAWHQRRSQDIALQHVAEILGQLLH